MRIVAPVALDLEPAQVALSASGAAAIGYGIQDADDPSSSTAWMIQGRRPGGYATPRALAGAERILGLAYGPRGLELLAGSSEAGKACCSQAEVVGPVRGGPSGAPRTLFTGLTGQTLGSLLALPGRLLAVAATERGVWAAQSAAGGIRFGAARRLSSAAQLPQSMDAIALGRGQSLIAWSARTGQITADGPRRVYIARGSLNRGPRAGRLLFSVPAGHQVEELALAGGAAAPTIAWIESWYDASGRLRTKVEVADVTSKVHPRTFSAGEASSGLSFAGAGGTQALSWESCTPNGDCGLRVVLRAGRTGFGRLERPGAIDATDTPAAVVSARGQAVIGWVHDGHVMALTGASGRLARPRTVARTNFAADLTLAARPRGALAVWTQGTLNQALYASTLR